MASTAAPYGLVPVGRLVGGRVLNGNPTNLYRIKSGYTGVIPYGAPVRMSTENDPSASFGPNYIVNVSDADMTSGGGSKDLYVGIFVGCTYTDPNTLQPQWSQWYPGSLAASDMQAYVIDDPAALFQIQAHSVDFNVYANIGYSFQLNIPGTPYNSSSKDSTISLDTGTSTAVGLPFKVVDIARLPNNTNASGYVDLLVKINSGFSIFERAL